MGGGGGGGGGGPGVFVGIEFGEKGVDSLEARNSTIGVPLSICGESCAIGVRGEESIMEGGEESVSNIVGLGLGFADAVLGGATEVASESVVSSVLSVSSELVRLSVIVVLSRTVLGFDDRVVLDNGESLPLAVRSFELELACLGPASTLLRLIGDCLPDRFGVRMLFALAALLMSVVAVRGGLGGAAPVVAGLDAWPLPRSVVFGVYGDIRGLRSSLLPTDSLL